MEGFHKEEGQGRTVGSLGDDSMLMPGTGSVCFSPKVAFLDFGWSSPGDDPSSFLDCMLGKGGHCGEYVDQHHCIY
jgi:hypothetical protein